ncbi:hypothetical protein J5N97_002506 [Dioscorea zingiberensis]|uniref:Retrovirus-related Pol polyprotein from transposon TNT 1-94 n=1 Tax=Dioscorea zingiberensis TaxID=325984 RepID=A0A9D5HP97_9LILI|nr:hypothetical protein J5N97_002506 [Dioscorea zingiberensis]
MIAYLDKLKGLADNLLDVASSVPNKDLILHTLNGLPSSYSAFKTIIHTRGTTLTIEELWTLLLSEEVNQLRESQKISPMAIAATTTPSSHTNHLCGREGRSDCGRCSGGLFGCRHSCHLLRVLLLCQDEWFAKFVLAPIILQYP